MSNKEQQLQQMVRNQQIRELSSSDEQSRQQTQSRTHLRKPIKNPFSGQSSDSEQNFDPTQTNISPFPPKQPKGPSVLEKAQQTMKWDKNEQLETQFLMKMEGQGMKDKKIRELASKLRSINIAYEKQKTLRKNLQNQLNSTMRINEETRKSSVEKDKKQSMQISRVKTETKCTACTESEKKIMEMRLKNQNMKTELNKALRVITRQIGQDFNIDQVLNQENGWKGRQQRIEKMKGHIQKLQGQLKNNGVNVSHMSGFTQVSALNKTNAPFSASSQRTSTLLAQNKRKEFDNLKIQVDALKSQNDLLQGKVKSLTSRKLILEKDIKDIRQQFEKKRQMFIEKSQNDDKFIQLLKNENQKLKRNERVITKVIYKDSNNEEVSSTRKQIDNIKKKPASQQKSKHNESNSLQDQFLEKEQKKVKGQLSPEKKKLLEEQFVNNDKYLRKMNTNDEEEIYRNWKKSKNMI